MGNQQYEKNKDIRNIVVIRDTRDERDTTEFRETKNTRHMRDTKDTRDDKKIMYTIPMISRIPTTSGK